MSILCRLISAGRKTKLQALVYDILPPTTATIDYVKGLEKLSATGQFFIGAQINVQWKHTAATNTSDALKANGNYIREAISISQQINMIRLTIAVAEFMPLSILSKHGEQD